MLHRLTYRFVTVGQVSGSGLGLAIADIIATRFGGELLLRNAEPGFEALLWMPFSKVRTEEGANVERSRLRFDRLLVQRQFSLGSAVQVAVRRPFALSRMALQLLMRERGSRPAASPTAALGPLIGNQSSTRVPCPGWL
jgi:hypothetical protein